MVVVVIAFHTAVFYLSLVILVAYVSQLRKDVCRGN